MKNQRGATLIEALAASSVLVIGILGLLASQTVAARQNQMAARQVRAAALAQDMVVSVRRWTYDDSHLANATANDSAVLESGPIGDAPPDAAGYEVNVNGLSPGAFAPPVDAATIDDNGDGAPDYLRYLHVAPLMVDGTQRGLLVSAVVAWRSDLGWRQVVMRQSKYDPAGNLATIPGL